MASNGNTDKRIEKAMLSALSSAKTIRKKIRQNIKKGTIEKTPHFISEGLK